MIGHLTRRAHTQHRESSLDLFDDFLRAQRTRIRQHLTCTEHRIKAFIDPGPYLGEKDCDEVVTRE